MILDTNAVSSHLDGDTQIRTILRRSAKYHLPLVVIAEYLFGLRGAQKSSRLSSLFRKLESDCELLLPDRATADWYVQIRHDLKQSGHAIPEGDLWIAALARQHALEIVSRDLHFDLVNNVRRVGW
jgi:predicted nucleic acid-binding protein